MRGSEEVGCGSDDGKFSDMSLGLVSRSIVGMLNDVFGLGVF